MRLLIWSPWFRPYIGGIEVMLAQLVRDLKARGYEMCVITSHDTLDLPDEDEYEGVPIYRFPFLSTVAGGDLKALAEILPRVAAVERQFKPDVVHASMIHSSLFFHLRTRGSHNAPLIVSVRDMAGEAHEIAASSIAMRAIEVASWVTANSQAVLTHVRRSWPEVTPRSSLIYDTLPEPAITPAPLPFDEPRIAFIGRVVEGKAPDLAVAAFAKIAERYPKARLVIGGDGQMLPALRKQADELGLAARVDFRGWIAPEEVPALINTATMVVTPSRWQEALGLVGIQASQLGRPVIVSRRGGLPEVVEDGKTGIVVENEDVEGLAGAMAYLLDHPAEAKTMGDAGRERMRLTFGWTNYVDSCDTLYQQIARGAS